MKITRKFFLMLIGGLIIQGGVSVKNSLENLKMNKPEIEMAAKGAFIFGWAVVAYSIAISKGGGLGLNLKSLLALAGAAMVVSAVMHVKMSKKAEKEPNKMIAMMFPGGWVVTALAIMMDKGKNSWLAILATGIVLVSMMFIIPKQRVLCLVDGPGYPMFANAWWLLAIANGIN